MASEQTTPSDGGNRAAAGTLEITVQPDPDGVVLLVEGDIDLATVPTLQLCLETVTTNAPDAVVVDLHGVTFMDSTGIAALAFARKQLTEASRSLRIKNPTPMVERLLRLVGIQDLLADTTDSVPTVESASS